MKALICGKGGAGKSAVTIMLAQKLAENHTVYVLDADESNRLLAHALAVEPPKTIADWLGGRNSVRDSPRMHEGFKLKELPPEHLRKAANGVYFASVGKIEEFGEGCACPYGFLSKQLLNMIKLEPGEALLVDTEAGIEHLGRGVEEGIDQLVVVVDPTAEGVAIASLLKDEAARIGKPLHVALNKVRSDIEQTMTLKLSEVGLEAAAHIRYDEEIFKSSLEGAPLKAGRAMEGVTALLKAMGT